jgi:hypothetical protein
MGVNPGGMGGGDASPHEYLIIPPPPPLFDMFNEILVI